MDNYIKVQQIDEKIDFHEFPKTTPIQRVDEVRAARQLDLKE